MSLSVCRHADTRESIARLFDIEVRSSTTSLPHHIQHLREVMSLSTTVGRLADHYVGRYLRKNGLSTTEVVNSAESVKICDCRHLATKCSCTDCSAYLSSNTEPRHKCCLTTQFLKKVTSKAYTNLTTSYLYQCRGLARRIHLYSPLIQYVVSSLSDVRTLVDSGITEECSSFFIQEEHRLELYHSGTIWLSYVKLDRQ